MDSPVSWFLLMLMMIGAFVYLLRAVIREEIRKTEEGQKEWTRLYNERREAEFRERYRNEERRYYFCFRHAAAAYSAETNTLIDGERDEKNKEKSRPWCARPQAGQENSGAPILICAPRVGRDGKPQAVLLAQQKALEAAIRFVGNG